MYSNLIIILALLLSFFGCWKNFLRFHNAKCKLQKNRIVGKYMCTDQIIFLFSKNPKKNSGSINNFKYKISY